MTTTTAAAARGVEAACCAHCPRPADIDLDDDGPMCLQCYSAFLLGIVRHNAPGVWLAATPALTGVARSPAQPRRGRTPRPPPHHQEPP